MTHESMRIADVVNRAENSFRVSEGTKRTYARSWEIVARELGDERLDEIHSEAFGRLRHQVVDDFLARKNQFELEHGRSHRTWTNGDALSDTFHNAIVKLFVLEGLEPPYLGRRNKARNSRREAIPFKTMQKVLELAPAIGPDPDLTEMVIDLLFETGARRHEILSLNHEHLNFEYNRLTIAGKGNSVRELPISRDLALRLRARPLKAINDTASASTPLLLRLDGTRFTGRSLDGIWERMRRALPDSVDAADKVSSHRVRYLTLTLVEREFSQEHARDFAGHKPMSTTAGYTKLVWTEKVFVHDHLFPHHPAANKASVATNPAATRISQFR